VAGARREDDGRAPGAGRGEQWLALLYGMVLRAQPLEARSAHGDELWRTLLDVTRAARRRGRLAAVSVALRECADIAWSGLAERGAVRIRTGGGRVNRGRGGRVGGLMGGAAEDVRYAFRKIGREPAFFAFAALIIGLGVGANTAVFSVVSPLLLRPLPFEQPERLVWVAHASEGGMSAVTSRSSNLRDYRALNRSFESLTGYFAFFEYGSYNLVGDGAPERLIGVGVAGNFLDVLGVRPLVGRNFVEEETVWNGRPAAILTHDFWVRRFAGDAGVVGRFLTLNGTPTEVIGVLPASFDFASTFAPGSRVDFLNAFPISGETDQWGNTLAMIGRLRPGATVAGAQADIDAMSARLAEEDPARWGLGAIVTGLQSQLAGRFRTAMVLLAGAAGVLLLVACANLSNLMLARGRRRAREMAVRKALGGNRRRLIRQLMVESLVLALIGGVVGVALAVIVTRLIASTTAVSIPLLSTASVDAAALVFTLAVTTAAGLILGIIPALQATGGRSAAALNDQSRGSTEGRRGAALREMLVVTEVALACVLLVGMGLLLRSFTRVLDVELGFQPTGAMLWQLDTSRPFDTGAERIAFFESLVARVEALPGVEEAGLTDTPPLGRNRGWGIRARGVVYEEGEAPSVFPRIVDSRYIRAMRIPLIAGRHFTTDDDGDAPPVLIINQTAARVLYPGQDPIGQFAIVNADDEHEIIGVVADVRHQSLEQESGLEMYLSYAQAETAIAGRTLSLVVRSRLAPAQLVSSVRGALREVDPAMPTADFQRLDEIVDRAVSPRRFILLLIGGFAMIALVLAALGIYAVLSFTVSQRIPEMGIRMALGESAGAIRRRVVGRTLALASLGVAIGAAIAFPVARLIRSMLFQVGATDPLTFAAMAALLLVVAFFAAYLPARRASRTSPLEALRTG